VFVSYKPLGKIHTPIHFFKASESGCKEWLWEAWCESPVSYYIVSGDHFSIFKMINDKQKTEAEKTGKKSGGTLKKLVKPVKIIFV
jgi:regulator of sigma D